MNSSLKLPPLNSRTTPASVNAESHRRVRNASSQRSHDAVAAAEQTRLLDGQPQSSAQACVSPGLENAVAVARHVADRRHFFLGGKAFGLASVSGVAMGLMAFLGGIAITGSRLSVLAVPAGAGFGIAGGLAKELYQRDPFDVDMLVEQGVAENEVDAREVFASLKEAGVIKPGGLRTPLSAMVSSVLPAHDFDTLTAEQRNNLETLLWTGARADQVPAGLWADLEAAENAIAFLHVRHDQVTRRYGRRAADRATYSRLPKASAKIDSLQVDIWHAIVRADV